MKIIGKDSYLPLKLYALIAFMIITLINTIKLSNSNFNYNSAAGMNFLNLQKALLSTDTIQVQNVIKKLPKIITYGLVLDQGIIYESGVINKQNFLIKKNYQNNQILKSIPLGTINGRGIAKCNNFFYQLTAIEKKILKYSFPDLNILTPITLDHDIGDRAEGLASLSNEVLVATDGTNNLHVLDCENDLGVIKTIPVYDSEQNPMDGLEDIVVVGEYVFANRRNDNRILKIDPRNGIVVRSYDMMNLINFELKMKSLSHSDIARGSILNGIAFDENRKVFILTGKNWGYYYEVDLK